MSRGPTYPWNPENPIRVSPDEYERQVKRWLSDVSKAEGREIRWELRKIVEGHGGDYEIDVAAELTLLGGAVVRLLVECKRHLRPVDRDDVLAFAMKIQDTGSHKGLMFSTAGFQRGAIKFAQSKNIATATFNDGRANYHTKSVGPSQPPPSWVTFPRYAGCFLATGPTGVSMRWFHSELLDPLTEWFGEGTFRTAEPLSPVQEDGEGRHV